MQKQVSLCILLLALVAAAAVTPIPSGRAAENLVLNPKLDYNSDRQDGPLITGDDMQNAELSSTQPTYLIIYGEG